jgi:hypothetical protein
LIIGGTGYPNSSQHFWNMISNIWKVRQFLKKSWNFEENPLKSVRKITKLIEKALFWKKIRNIRETVGRKFANILNLERCKGFWIL